MNHTLKLLLALAVSFGLLTTTSQAEPYGPSGEDIAIDVISVAVVVGGTIWLFNSSNKKKKAASEEDLSAIDPISDRSLSYAKYGNAKAPRARRSIDKRFKTQLRTYKGKTMLLAFNMEF